MDEEREKTDEKMTKKNALEINNLKTVKNNIIFFVRLEVVL